MHPALVPYYVGRAATDNKPINVGMRVDSSPRQALGTKKGLMKRKEPEPRPPQQVPRRATSHSHQGSWQG